jgi:hypothetical protein
MILVYMARGNVWIDGMDVIEASACKYTIQIVESAQSMLVPLSLPVWLEVVSYET